MSPDASALKDALLLALLVGLLLTAAEPGAVNALPGFSDRTGPTELSVASFERLDSGCEDEMSTHVGGSTGGGSYSQVSFVETGDPDADLAAWTERTSPPGADLSTFRVHVESRADGATDAPCRAGVRYRIEVATGGANPEGLLPDAHGTRILWLQNGEYAGCSASYTGPLRADCSRFSDDDRPNRTWANATTA